MFVINFSFFSYKTTVNRTIRCIIGAGLGFKTVKQVMLAEPSFSARQTCFVYLGTLYVHSCIICQFFRNRSCMISVGVKVHLRISNKLVPA